ncbi:M23 family metallopeptidase [Streptomyces gamaensis]|uniref:M23 family metallopeptidase n=1 Tax=Streptomyces gamaensis TaxID=1763542 RepID=A0ABW0Z9E1_9ACTN
MTTTAGYEDTTAHAAATADEFPVVPLVRPYVPQAADAMPEPAVRTDVRVDVRTTAPGTAEPAEPAELAEDPGAPVRGRHRVPKPRGGTMARSGAVLGVGVIAAVGAGGMASAQERPQAPISVPDLVQNLPGVGALIGGDQAEDGTKSQTEQADSRTQSQAQPLTQLGLTAEEVAQGTPNAGEALRARILQQAEYQQSAAEREAREAAHQAAAEEQKQAAEEKAEQAEEEEEAQAEQAEAEREAQAARAEAEREAQAAQAKAQAEAERKAAEAEAQRKAAAEKAEHKAQPTQPEVHKHKQQQKQQPHQPKPQQHASNTAPAPKGTASAPKGATATRTYVLPVRSYTLTAGFGQAGNMWSAHHTGEDFAASPGTPVKAVSGGTITSAGWAGAYGYRVVLTLDDGTQLWFCHLSSMTVTSGKVKAGDVIGRVGATGNVTGPHLHLEVRPGGGTPIDPLPWLRGRGLHP